jgi:hypothetical protein
MTTQNTPTTGIPPLAPLIVARRAPLLVSFTDAINSVLQHLILIALARQDLNETAIECSLGPAESCELSSFVQNASYVVRTNSSEARCIFANSTTYGFQVWKLITFVQE